MIMIARQHNKLWTDMSYVTPTCNNQYDTWDGPLSWHLLSEHTYWIWWNSVLSVDFEEHISCIFGTPYGSNLKCWARPLPGRNPNLSLKFHADWWVAANQLLSPAFVDLLWSIADAFFNWSWTFIKEMCTFIPLWFVPDLVWMEWKSKNKFDFTDFYFLLISKKSNIVDFMVKEIFL